jgi:membrane fusion protein (multidrug efflux system)
MRAIMKNDDASLSPGQFVRVQLKGAIKSKAIALPQRAILDGPGGKYVYVASPGANGMTVALQKNIVPGEWVNLDEQRKNYWIIRSGLELGDEVIVDGVARIFFPGMPVAAAAPETSSATAQQ